MMGACMASKGRKNTHTTHYTHYTPDEIVYQVYKVLVLILPGEDESGPAHLYSPRRPPHETRRAARRIHRAICGKGSKGKAALPEDVPGDFTCYSAIYELGTIFYFDMLRSNYCPCHVFSFPALHGQHQI